MCVFVCITTPVTTYGGRGSQYKLLQHHEQVCQWQGVESILLQSCLKFRVIPFLVCLPHHRYRTQSSLLFNHFCYSALFYSFIHVELYNISWSYFYDSIDLSAFLGFFPSNFVHFCVSHLTRQSRHSTFIFRRVPVKSAARLKSRSKKIMV